MIIINRISSGKNSNSSKCSSNSRSSNCSSAVAAVVEAILTSRNCNSSSSSSCSSRRKCSSSSSTICIFFAFSLENSNSDDGDNTFKGFSECPKTSGHKSNATPFKEVQCFMLSLRAALRLIRAYKRKLGQSAHIAFRSATLLPQ